MNRRAIKESFSVPCFVPFLQPDGRREKTERFLSRFSIYRKYEKCNPALFPPEVKSTKSGGLSPPCVMYCTFNRETPPFTRAGAEPPFGCEIFSSKIC